MFAALFCSSPVNCHVLDARVRRAEQHGVAAVLIATISGTQLKPNVCSETVIRSR